MKRPYIGSIYIHMYWVGGGGGGDEGGGEGGGGNSDIHIATHQQHISNTSATH